MRQSPEKLRPYRTRSFAALKNLALDNWSDAAILNQLLAEIGNRLSAVNREQFRAPLEGRLADIKGSHQAVADPERTFVEPAPRTRGSDLALLSALGYDSRSSDLPRWTATCR